MASYPVGDLPAVSDALEHLREVDKELRDDGGPFSAEASFHLSKITAALTHLEGYQRAAQEGLEAETAENRRLARRINQTKETTRQDILADVAAARTCGAAERDQLQGELMDVSRLLGAAAERQEDLTRQNETLQAEQAQAQGERQALAAALNRQLSITKALQTRLHRSREQTEELASCSVRAEQRKAKLQRGMELERQAFTVKREGACREVERAEEQIKQQKQGVRRARRAVAGVRDAQRGAQQRCNELTFQMATLESSLQQVTASRSQCEEELERHRQTHRQLREKKELLRKDLQGSKVTSGALIQRLREEIQALERDAQEARASGALHGDSLAGVCGTWAQQQEEESQARAEHLRAQQQLHRSTLQLQQRAAANARRREEVREMEEQMAALERAGAASQRLLERDLQEMSSTLEEQRRSALHWEEEKEKLAQLLEAARRRQEEREARLTSDLGRSRRRYQELLQEEAALQEQQPGSLDADLLRRRLKEREDRCREEEARRRQEAERYAAHADTVRQRNQERQRQVEEQEERLKEAQAAWRAEQLRHTRMKSLLDGLKTQEGDLQRTLRELRKETGSLLQPREEAEAQLEVARERYMEALGSQTSALGDAEAGLYDCLVKVEQVRLENSRFQLRIRQLTEEASRAEEDGERYGEEARLLRQEVQDVLDSLQRRWEEDASVGRERQSSDGALLAALSLTRREELETVGSLARTLGDGAVPVQQSL